MAWGLVVILFLTCIRGFNGQTACTDANLAGNIRYSYSYPRADCNQYRQCHKRPGTNEAVIVYRSCPYGLYWNPATFNCELPSSFSCPLDLDVCSGRVEGSGCRAYWDCSNGNVIPKCCDPGFRYVPGEGCVPDYTCTDPCPGPCAENFVCRSFLHWQDNTKFYKSEGGVSYERICRTGTTFDLLECGCVASTGGCSPTYSVDFRIQGSYGDATSSWLSATSLIVGDNKATFRSGASLRGNVRLPQPSLSRPLVIKFGYKEISILTQTRILFESNDCKNCNRLRINLVGSTATADFQVTLTKRDKIMAQVTLSTEGFATAQWKDAVVMYNGRELLGMIRSGNITYLKRTEAPVLTIMDCGMNFGLGASSQRFDGELQYLSIYSCNPGGRALGLFDTVQ